MPEVDESEESEGEEAEADMEGVTGRDFALAFERSIHGFSGGIRGTVYCATAGRDKSHRFGAQTPTRTRQAATTRLTLLGSECMSERVMDFTTLRPQRSTYRS